MSDSEGTMDGSKIVDYLSKLSGHTTYIGLAIIALFISIVRVRNIQNFIVGGKPILGGTSSWYQLRSVQYSVRNWPNTIEFDPFVSPTGEKLGLYGTLYDQIIATISIIVGLGSPTYETIATVLLYAPPIFAGLTVIPTYLLSKELDTNVSGWISSVILALLPGLFFFRSLIGVSDYHVSIPLFLMSTLYITARSLSNLKEYSTDDVTINSIVGVKPPQIIRDGFISGISVVLLILVWPLGVLLVGAFLLFIVIDSNRRYLLGGTADTLLYYSIIYSVTTSVFMFIAIDTMTFQISDFSLLHALLPLTITVYSILTLAVSRQDIINNLRIYPISSVGIFIILFLSGIFIDSRLLESVFIGLKSTFGLWFVESAFGTRSVGTSFISVARNLYTYFGAMVGVSLISIFLLYWDSLTRGTSETAYISIASVVLVSASITNIDFNFYVAPLIAVLSGIFIYRIIERIGFIREFPELDFSQYVSLGVVLILFIPMLLVPMGGTVFFAGSNHSPGGAQEWSETTDWIKEETPETGIDIYSHRTTSTSDSYRILTWKSQGTWVVSGGERPVITSSITTNSTLASKLLLASNETEFERLNSENVKYVAISNDEVAVTGEFIDIVESHPTSTTDEYFFPVRNRNTGEFAGTIRKQAYYESIGYRLYASNGARIRTQPIVSNWDIQRTQQGSVAVTPRNGSVREFDSYRDALLFVEQDGSAQIGGSAGIPPSSVSALEHFRLIHVSSNNITSESETPKVKVFENVPGATIKGDGPSNTTVLARVQLSSPSGYTFVYSQVAQTDSNGNFTMVVPYATAGYNGNSDYANTSIRADMPYQFRAISETNNTTVRFQTTIDINESAVVQEDSEPINITLEPIAETQNSTN